MKKTKEFIKHIIKDESGQGTTEYVLLLVVLVGIALLFKRQITDIVKSKIEEVGGMIGGFSAQ